VGTRNLSMPCLHCDHAPCLQACPVAAITKRDDGVVLVDQATCVGCMFCFWACPFGVPQFGAEGKMSKCTFCADRPAELPRACEEVCPTKAILSGEMHELEALAARSGGERVGGPAAPAMLVIRQQPAITRMAAFWLLPPPPIGALFPALYRTLLPH